MARNNGVYCAFGGIDCRDIGLRLTKYPDRPMAEVKAKTVEIPARNGDLILLEDAYKDFDIKATFIATAETDYTKFGAWLDGLKELTFGDDDTYAYTARVIKSVANKHGRYFDGTEQYDITFHCHPLKHLQREKPVTLGSSDSGAFIKGKGNVDSRPLITVAFEQPTTAASTAHNITLIVGAYCISIDWKGVELVSSSTRKGDITIDCDAMIAYNDDFNLCSHVTIITDGYDDDFPILSANGQTTQVTWSTTNATVDGISIQPRWRWR